MDDRSQHALEGPPLTFEEVPGSLIAFTADSAMRIVFMNSHVVSLLGCESVEDVRAISGGSLRPLVFEDDMESFGDFVAMLAREPGTFAYTYFHLRTKDGTVLNAVAHGKVVGQRGTDHPVCHAFISSLGRFRTVDWLTGLHTRDRFHRIARDRAVAFEEDGLTPVAVAFDLTGFKGFNDRYGHDRGDEALRTFAGLLTDVFGKDACARFGEDHFYAIGETRTVEALVERLLAAYERTRLAVRPPVRAGLYALEGTDDIADAGFDRAKVACDIDRKSWHSHLTWFTSEMGNAERIRIHVLESLDTAIDRHWIRPYYQAIARSSTGDICGEEALARWVDPEYGFLSPAQFIPVIEQAGISFRLDLHMVDCVLADIHTKQRMGVPVVPVSVNFSMSDLTQIDIAHEVSQRADAVGIRHGLVVIEFTESAASANPDLFRTQVGRLRDAGFEVWMDDFGSGYSSLNILQQFDFDLVKLDMGFVRGLIGERGERSRMVVSSILAGVTQMGLDTLAEGVETAEQAEFLQAAGCDMLQGYLLSRPHPLEDILDATSRPPRERQDESEYWDLIGRTNLSSVFQADVADGVDATLMGEMPVGVVEFRDGQWRILKANAAYRAFLDDTGLVPGCRLRLKADAIVNDALDTEFVEAATRARQTLAWERVMGSLERGTGHQFFVRLLASSSSADAFAVATVPILLGSALGSFGDVPVAYAVFRVVTDEATGAVSDLVYAFANQRYLSWIGRREEELKGRSFMDTVEGASAAWLPYAWRATVLKETIHDTIWNPEIGHWLTFDLAPCAMDGYCVFAFTTADREQHEREELTADLDTSDLIITIADDFSGELSYDAAMDKLLARLSQVAHASRISIIERGEHTSSLTFEWCAEGVMSLMGIMSNMDNSEFDEWERSTQKDSLVVVPDVTDSDAIDKGHLAEMAERGITCVMVVPIRYDDVTLGYLVTDNYEFDRRLDLLRLMERVASFIAARMANHRLVDQLRGASLHDGLTGLLNRRGIDLACREQSEARPDEPFVLALMDIDDFKVVNDLYGHDVGDEALRTLARRVCAAFPEDAIIGRNGGDEFLVLLRGCDERAAARMIGDLIASDLSCTYAGRTYPLSMSAGHVAYPCVASDLMDAYSKADKALYAVKLSGKAGCRAYTDDMEHQHRSQLGFTPRDIADNIPAAIFAHRATGEVLFANDEAVRLLGCADLGDLMAWLDGTFERAVAPDDVGRVRAACERHLAPDASRAHESFRLRLQTKAGATVEATCRSRAVEFAGIGKVVYELVTCDG